VGVGAEMQPGQCRIGKTKTTARFYMAGLRLMVLFGIALIMLFLLNHEIVYSQDELTEAIDSLEAVNTSEDAGNVAEVVSLMSNREFVLSVIILLFGIAIVVIEYRLIKTAVNPNVTDIMKIFTVTLIIIGTMLLISSGFSSQQIAPAFGLFGTIAGYLLGREETRKKNGGESDKEVDNV
jgi:Na+/melibiose symporter-like transporter